MSREKEQTKDEEKQAAPEMITLKVQILKTTFMLNKVQPIMVKGPDGKDVPNIITVSAIKGSKEMQRIESNIAHKIVKVVRD